MAKKVCLKFLQISQQNSCFQVLWRIHILNFMTRKTKSQWNAFRLNTFNLVKNLFLEGIFLRTDFEPRLILLLYTKIQISNSCCFFNRSIEAIHWQIQSKLLQIALLSMKMVYRSNYLVDTMTLLHRYCDITIRRCPVMAI